MAVTLRAWLRLTVQVAAVPEQSPLQPLKLLPVDAMAVRITLVPLSKFTLQDEPQLMPDGLLATVPEPVPNEATISTCLLAANVAVTLRA